MDKHIENGSVRDLMAKGKKEWRNPKMTQLSIKETKLGLGAQGKETWTNWFGS